LTRRLDAGTSKLGDEIRFKAAAEMELKRYVIVFALRLYDVVDYASFPLAALVPGNVTIKDLCMSLRGLRRSVSLLLLGCSTAQADEIRLINGDRVTGRLVSLSRTLCLFEAPQYATVLQVQTQVLAKLETSEPVVMTMTDGERYVGRLTWSKDAGFRLVSARSGVVTVKAQEVARIEARHAATHGAVIAELDDTALSAAAGRGGTGVGRAAPSGAPRPTDLESDPLPSRPDPAPTQAAALIAPPKPLAAAAPAMAPPARPNPVVTTLLERGRHFWELGDVTAARLFYETAAARGSAEAATAVGMSHDPHYLREIGARGIAPDPAKAAQWYRKARDLGDPQTEHRLQAQAAQAAPQPEAPAAPIPPPTPRQTPVSPPANGSTPTIGQQEEDAEDLGRVFLRNTTVLLTPGQVEVEAAFSYARDEVLTDIRSRTRSLTLDATVRVGLLDGLEGYVTVPFGYAEDQRFVGDEAASGDRFGLSDISSGLRYLILSESDVLPEVTLGLDVRAPVGQEPNLNADTSPALGSGRWRVGGSLTFVRSYDPAVIFGTLGYNHGFEGTVSGDEIGGGHVYSYAFGAGFAVNNQITLSGQFQGAYQTHLRFNDVKSTGSDREPMSLRSSLTYRIAPNQYIEPSIQYGLNDDAVDAILMLSYTGRL
jgi:hypothetical protein